MTVKAATITDVLNEKPYDNKFGRTYYYDLVLDNGDRGNSGTKTRDGFKVGDELIYTITESDHGPKIKKASPEEADAYRAQHSNGQSNGQQANPQPTVRNFGGRGSDASFALSYAKDFIGKAMELKTLAHEGDPVSVNQWVEATLVTASKFHAWMKDHSE